MVSLCMEHLGQSQEHHRCWIHGSDRGKGDRAIEEPACIAWGCLGFCRMERAA